MHILVIISCMVYDLRYFYVKQKYVALMGILHNVLYRDILVVAVVCCALMFYYFSIFMILLLNLDKTLFFVWQLLMEYWLDKTYLVQVQFKTVLQIGVMQDIGCRIFNKMVWLLMRNPDTLLVWVESTCMWDNTSFFNTQKQYRLLTCVVSCWYFVHYMGDFCVQLLRNYQADWAQ